jgi:DNA-binding HxlR family transcriptional regulator
VSVRYAQFCALARASEILGERWTLLIIRGLMLGPQRFSDLKTSLNGISTSVLSERLNHMEQLGLLRRRYLEPPAASTVYELTDVGLGLKPVLFALIRWGGHFLFPPRDDDRFDPRWTALALDACASTAPAPEGTIAIQIHERDGSAGVRVEGGEAGTRITRVAGDEDVSIATDTPTLLGLISGNLDPVQAERQMLVRVDGDRSVFQQLSNFFDTKGTRHGTGTTTR